MGHHAALIFDLVPSARHHPKLQDLGHGVSIHRYMETICIVHKKSL